MRRGALKARSLHLGLAASALLAFAGAAFGQYQDNMNQSLGGGLALSRNNPNAGQNRDFSAEFRARNSIVYGSAPGGLAFQGGLGYRNPSDFQGFLGSN